MYGHVKSCIPERRCTVPHVPCLTSIGYCLGLCGDHFCILYNVSVKDQIMNLQKGSLTHLTKLPASTEQKAGLVGSAMPSVITNYASLNYRIVNLVHPLSILHRGSVDDFQPVSALPPFEMAWWNRALPALIPRHLHLPAPS